MIHPFRDIFNALARIDIWLRLGVRDVFLQYRRAGLGVVWALVNVSIWIGVVQVFLGPAIASDRPYFLSYVAIGMVTYNFAVSIIAGGASCLSKYRSQVLSLPIPIFGIAIRHTTSALLVFAIQSIAVFGSLYLDGIVLDMNALAILPSILVFVVLSLMACSGLMVIGALYADFVFLLQSVMRILLIATPIFWYADQLNNSLRTAMSGFNPLAGAISAFRHLLGVDTSWDPIYFWSYGIFTAFAVLMFAVYIFTYRNLRKKL